MAWASPKSCGLPPLFHASLVYLLLSASFPHDIFSTLHCPYIFFHSITCSGLRRYIKLSSQQDSTVKLLFVMHHCLVHVSGDHGCQTTVSVLFCLILTLSCAPWQVLVDTDLIYQSVLFLSLLYCVLMLLLSRFNKFVHNWHMNPYQRVCCRI